MLEINILDLLFLTILLLLINYLLKMKDFLIDKPIFSEHKIANKNKIALSGGAFLSLSLLYFKLKYPMHVSNLIYIFLLLIPLGILSDKNILKSPSKRFLIQLFILILAVTSFDIQIQNTRLIFLDNLLSIKYLNYIFTIFCILVLINGSNFIDGLNSLAAGYFLILCSSIMLLSPIDGGILKKDEIFYILFLILSVFSVFNFLNLNFLGDNGIYFLSAFIGYSLIELSNFNNFYISPIYIVSLLWYPAFENLFSILRRIYKRGKVSNPDNLHFHALIYLKMKNKFSNLNANNLSTLLVLLFSIPGFILSNLFHYQSLILGLIIFGNVLMYLSIYYLLKK